AVGSWLLAFKPRQPAFQPRSGDILKPGTSVSGRIQKERNTSVGTVQICGLRSAKSQEPKAKSVSSDLRPHPRLEPTPPPSHRPRPAQRRNPARRPAIALRP